MKALPIVLYNRGRSAVSRRGCAVAAIFDGVRVMAALRRILIVGGGTAGWLSACYLARTLNAASAQSIQITLVESADIGILGVGEGTFPSIRGTLALIGLDEARFIRGAT